MRHLFGLKGNAKEALSGNIGAVHHKIALHTRIGTGLI